MQRRSSAVIHLLALMLAAAAATLIASALVGLSQAGATGKAGATRTAAAAGAAASALLPPHNPAHALAVAESLWPSCTGAHDYSPGCIESSLAMLNAGRRAEGLGPLILPANWEHLTVAEQLFVLSDLERTARGLPPDTGLAADWNAAAQAGADVGQDPSHGGRGAGGFEAVWAGGEQNPIIVMADWIYADGVFPDGTSQNLGCSAQDSAGCWSHRDIVLHDTAAAACRGRCAVGAAFSATGFSAAGAGVGHESYAEVFGIDGGGNHDPLVFTWRAELPQLPVCERTGDSCSWAGSPIAGAHGITDAGGGSSAGGSSSGAGPRLRVRVNSRLGRGGWLRMEIRVGRRLSRVSVVARCARRRVSLRVRRRPDLRYLATGRLGAGRWTITILYRRGHARRMRLLSRARLTVR